MTSETGLRWTGRNAFAGHPTATVTAIILWSRIPIMQPPMETTPLLLQTPGAVGFDLGVLADNLLRRKRFPGFDGTQHAVGVQVDPRVNHLGRSVAGLAQMRPGEQLCQQGHKLGPEVLDLIPL